MRGAETGNDKADERLARQRRKFGRVEEIGYQRSGGKQNGVDYDAREATEPEHGVVVLVLYFLLVHDGGNESALLNASGNEREYG